MAYAAEEVGLRGSQDIVDRYAGKKVVGVVQFDMTNFKGAENDMYFLTDNVDEALTGFLERLADEYLKIKWGTIECGYGCSDHASWTRGGFPASCAFEATMETMDHHIHTENDTLANAGGNARHSVNFAKLAVAFAGELGKNGARGSSAAK
jgi:leucyl aminopeptidase